MNIDFGNIEEKFQLIKNYWDPHIISELNGQYLKIAKIKGEFEIHSHTEEDELFLVYKGSFEMELENEKKVIKEGEFITIPKGILHKPVAKEECWIILFEPKSTLNTGNVKNEFTKSELKRI